MQNSLPAGGSSLQLLQHAINEEPHLHSLSVGSGYASVVAPSGCQRHPLAESQELEEYSLGHGYPA